MFLTRSGTNWEDGLRPEILDLGSRGIVLCCKNKGSYQLHSNHAADLLFRSRFFYDSALKMAFGNVVIVSTAKPTH